MTLAARTFATAWTGQRTSRPPQVNARSIERKTRLIEQELGQRLYLPREAARILRVLPSTLRQWVGEGKIGCIRPNGRHRRYPEAEVERVRREQEKGAHWDLEAKFREERGR
jgi:excisionase family DNA binding protein